MAEKEIEEALSIIWELREKNENTKEKVSAEILRRLNKDILEDLVKIGYVLVSANEVKFTSSGEAIAKDLIRRQRITERLLYDVLEIKEDTLSSFACEFEHILSKEVEESICTLLGHPKQCPHGSPIPEGECCSKGKEILKSIVVPLSKLRANQEGKVVYILTGKQSQLHKLLSLGISPGSIIKVHQTFPSFVIQSGETQIAIEESVAENIYVKRSKL